MGELPISNPEEAMETDQPSATASQIVPSTSQEDLWAMLEEMQAPPSPISPVNSLTDIATPPSNSQTDCQRTRNIWSWYKGVETGPQEAISDISMLMSKGIHRQTLPGIPTDIPAISEDASSSSSGISLSSNSSSNSDNPNWTDLNSKKYGNNSSMSSLTSDPDIRSLFGNNSSSSLPFDPNMEHILKTEEDTGPTPGCSWWGADIYQPPRDGTGRAPSPSPLEEFLEALDGIQLPCEAGRESPFGDKSPWSEWFDHLETPSGRNTPTFD